MPDDVLMRVTVHNRGPDPATIHILPQVWFRNTWSWSPGVHKPSLQHEGAGLVLAQHDELGTYSIEFEAADRLLFCDNETNFARLFGTNPGAGPLQGRVPRLRRPRPHGRGEPGRQRHQGRGALPADGSGRAAA